MKNLLLLAALAACQARPESTIEPRPVLLGGGGGPSITYYRHVLRADGKVVGEIIVIYIPPR